MDLGGYTAIGPRDANEDNYFTLDFSNVNSFSNGIVSFVMVSDGMGGYQGGDVASDLAVSSAESYMNQLLDMAAGNKIDFDAQSALGEIVRNAHEAILAEARARGGTSMGATFVGAFLSPTHAWIGHVGDSRAYLVRGGEITQITEDHSQVGRMLSRGLITEEEAQNHPARNRIERALGFSEAEPEFNEVDLQPGDVLMLCSDGVYTVLDREAICGFLGGGRDAEAAAKRIVKTALSRGTDDNSTAVVAVNAEGAPGKGGKRRTQSTIRTPAVSGTRYGSVNPVRTGSSRSRSGVSGSRAPQRPRRSMRTIVIPVAVAVVAVAVIAGVFIWSNPGSAEMNGAPEASGPGVAASQGSTADPLPADERSSSSSTVVSSSSASSSSSAVVGAFVNEAITKPGLLKYVDSSGVAHQFVETWPQVPGANVGAVSVPVEVDGQSYQQSGKTYRTLPDSYRDDLLGDYASYLNSGRVASQSDLSRLVDAYDSGEYESFLQALMSSGVDRNTLDLEVSKLILDADCFGGVSALAEQRSSDAV